jgi:hypothetical protein
MRRGLAVLFALLLVALPSFATVPWGPEDAARARASFVLGERPDFPPSLRYSGDNLDDYLLAAEFIASLQVSDPLEPSFGGIREGEHMLDVIQTDNTSESIWIFSRYFELTGDSAILDNLAASWAYVLAHPAYLEEGGDDIYAGYYRIYNCGWALCAQMKYLDVFGDSTYRSYADSCAGYLNTHNLVRFGTTGFYDLVNPPILAWAAGNLYEYAVRAGNATWRDTAWRRGNRVKGWVQNDALVLGNEEWAVSGGMAMWGLLESYFREYPAEESLWVAQHAAEMDTVSDPGPSENAWNGWYALGMKRLEVSTGDPVWGTRHLNLTNYLRAFDTDDDGGIQVQPADTDTMDQTWVTSYLAFMGFDPLLQEMTGIASPLPGAPAVLLANRPNPFNPETAITFRLGEPGRVVVDVYDPAGRRVARLFDGAMGSGLHTVAWGGVDDGGTAVPSGVYFARLLAGRYAETRKMVLVR